ncbi:MAG TPA: helix-turn-helix domain-containing protein [Burkholderiaceae bacterium]|nr:helix-turn-helix domain-containing protein [Burkholderiaceae bacterium]
MTNDQTPQPHVLLVDDNPDQLRLLIDTLRGCGYRLSIAFDGAQGYDRAVSNVPDLMILDVRMPRMDGFALCRRLKANSSTAHIPIIFLSSAGDIEEKLTGLRGGAVDYILKPYAPEEVVARVRIHLELAGKTRNAAADAPDVVMDEDEVLVRAAQRELQDCLSLTPRLMDIAERLGVNERRLSRAFRKCLDMTPFDYLRQARMNEARRLLVETPLSIVAISEEVGFSSAANFSTAFREHTGVAPSDYRRGGVDDAPEGSGPTP